MIGQIPLDSTVDPAIGLNSEGKYHKTPNKGLTKQMSYIAEVLNLKEHPFLFKHDDQFSQVAVSPLIEVHRRNNAQYNFDEEKEDEYFTKNTRMNFHIHELDVCFFIYL